MATKKKPQKKQIKDKPKPAAKKTPIKLQEYVYKQKLPEQVIENTIAETAGEEAVAVYRLLKGKEDVNEFTIAEKLGAPINYVRNIMYKFEQNNLLTSIRKKDRKKGWYIYFYTLDIKETEQLVLQAKKKKIEIYKRQLERENLHQFYVCPNKCSRFTLENTMEHNFLCPECGTLMTPEDKEKTLTRIKKSIDEIETEVNKLDVIMTS